MPSDYTSEITGKVYHIFDVSPLALNLYKSEATQSEEAIELQLQITSVVDSLNEDTEAIKRQDVQKDEKLKVAIEKRIADASVQLAKLNIKYASVTKAKPESICKVLKHFVQECEKLEDLAIIRMGYDFDLLYLRVQEIGNEHGDKYGHVIDKFRARQRSSSATSKPGESVPHATA